jgi:DNA-binding CsgD family transcriptional regulator
MAPVWRGAGAYPLRLRLSTGVPSWDVFGVRAVLAAVRNHFELFGDHRLVDSVSAVSRLCQPATYRSRQGSSGLLAEVGKLLGRLRRDRQVVLVADDLPADAEPVLALTSARQAGCLVVAACRDDLAAGPVWLSSAADRVLDLGPLSDDEAEQLVTRVLNGQSSADSLVPALRSALGPLFGNPGAVVSTVESLRAAGRLVEVHGRLCLDDPAAPIHLATGHPLVEQVWRAGQPGVELFTMVATAEEFAVDDLPAFAAATGRPLADHGRVVDHLVRAGVLECAPAGDLACRCPALAASVLATVRPDTVRRLHGVYAAHLCGLDAAARPDPAVLAMQAVGAGRALPPDPALGELLIAEAGRIADIRPDRAAEWYGAALWHVGRDRPDRSGVLTELGRLLVRAGRYDRLGDVVADAVGGSVALDPELRGTMAALAGLAALHTGVPVSRRVHAALGDNGSLEQCDRWFDGTREISSVFPVLRLRSAPARPGAGGEDLVDAAATGDLVARFRLVFGSDYGQPTTGPLAACHRVVWCFAGGEWSAALSAARQLELAQGPSDTPAHLLGRLLAAEICAARGEQDQALTWLAGVPEHDWLRGLRAWVTCGLPGSRDAAVGLERLLTRLLHLAVDSDQPARAERIFAEIEDWHRFEFSRASGEAALVGNALVNADVAGAQATAGLARQRGHLPDLALACLVVGQLSTDPRPWLYEAHEIAHRLGAPALRARCVRLMREREVSVPRAAGQDARLSETELRIVTLIRHGRTNRQIAVAIGVGEKSVENYLTRLFAKTGCRSRLDLTAASLAGRLVAVGE